MEFESLRDALLDEDEPVKNESKYGHDRDRPSYSLNAQPFGSQNAYRSYSSPPSVAYMRQSISSALVQIMACSLFGAKPLSMPMLGYCQMDPSEQTSVKF